jgi:hypothetical protein
MIRAGHFIDGIAFFILLLCGLGQAYDYSEPMRCISALPLGYPESPFVLRFTPRELQGQPIWGSHLDTIVIADNAPPSIRTGAEALRSTLTKLGLGPVSMMELDSTQAMLPATITGKNMIVLGVPEQFALAESLAKGIALEVTDPALNGDGFIIKPIKMDACEVLLIVSPVARGVLYGAYELEERTSGRGIPRIDQKFVPLVRYRGWPTHVFVENPPDAIGRWRLNLSMVTDWYYGTTNSLLFYKDFPELGGDRQRELVLSQQKKLHEKFANAIKNGAMPAITWNPLSVTLTPSVGLISFKEYQGALAKAHPGIVALPYKGSDRVNLCPSNPATRRYVESAVREFVETFPEIDVMNIMLSDVGGELICGCDKCKTYPYLDRVADYMALVIDTAHKVKPTIHFMLCPSGLMSPLMDHHPEFHGDKIAGILALQKRLGPVVEAYFLSVGSPPGDDCLSWLAPDCAVLGHDVPLVAYFQHYEADGPGIVSPISSIISHLSWSLPQHLNTLQRCARKDMIGAMIQGAGVEVGCWHPDLDGNKYMRNWCRAKYGREAGGLVFQALENTHKITEAFYLETKPYCIESVDFYRWGEYCGPWALEMSSLKKAGLSDLETSCVINNISLAFTMPQAPQPAGLRKVSPSDREQWIKRFELKKEIGIARGAEESLARAMALRPGDPELRQLHETARATQALVLLFQSYHWALIEANCARNAASADARQKQIERSRKYLQESIRQTIRYRDIFLPLVRNQNDNLGSLKFNAPIKYLGNIIALLREACYLHDREFGGESLRASFDRDLELKNRKT